MRDRPSNSGKSDWLMDAGPAEDVLDDDRPIPSARGVLTKAEIEALLRPETLSGEITPQPEPEVIKPRLPVQFDNQPVETVDVEARRSAGVLASRLALAIGKGTGLKAAISVQDVGTVKSSELAGLMNGKAGAVACLGTSDQDVEALICLPGPLADAIIARACGSRGSTGRLGDGWNLSAIDCALLEQLLVPLGGVIGEGIRLQAIETNVPYVTSLIPEGDVTIAEFGVEAPGLRSEIAVIQTKQPERDAPKGAALRGRSPVTAVVTARIATLAVPMSRLTSLKAGSTLLLGLPGDQPVEILSGDRSGPVAFEGQVGRKGNKVAVKVTRKLHGVLD
jgi:flagellar motor switch/type III secretory pathway protein FliN